MFEKVQCRVCGNNTLRFIAKTEIFISKTVKGTYKK